MKSANQLALSRRKFIQVGTSGATLFLSGCSTLLPRKSSEEVYYSLSNIGPLLPPDENNMMLPEGFRSRIVAKTGFRPVPSSSYIWHLEPDGGATFAMKDGGWVYVSNSEIGQNKGGVGALRFNAEGELIDAYPILAGTRWNCAGGATPWGTWLSCEETTKGLVYECDPSGVKEAIVRPFLGAFMHEAAAVDIVNNCIYMTEDTPDGGFYRFVAKNKLPDLTEGELEIASIQSNDKTTHIKWLKVPDPLALEIPTRKQVKGAAKFRGGEGIAIQNNSVYFTTKHDNRVWVYDTKDQTLDILYDIKTSDNPILKGVDNLSITPAGDVLVAEDNGDMQLVILTPDKKVIPFLQLIGHEHSELAGQAFDPYFKRMYISSQRGFSTNKAGITYEVTYQP